MLLLLMIMTTMMIMMTFVCLFSLFTANMLEDIPHLILQIVIISSNSVRKTFSYSFTKFLSAQSAYVSRENGECPVSTGILPHSLPEWAFRARPGLWRNCLCPKVARIAEQKFGSR